MIDVKILIFKFNGEGEKIGGYTFIERVVYIKIIFNKNYNFYHCKYVPIDGVWAIFETFLLDRLLTV
ncbi:hypothetical protein BGC07_06050 [Piscirickettsia litoralis]|uniref:Uncharacterized protein n=1 Tax=Piscirickettsia litoralis TaxID=1891921 RepID=A0ABX3A2A2_9GAMM|nr:hypothetical protein BGC07_06050 [Piscirickettsia litoralis]